MLGIAIVGFGYWGPNLVRNFALGGDCAVKTVVDLREERLSMVRKLYPGIRTTTSSEDVLKDPDVDAVVIALPISLHYPFAKSALMAGKHVLLEKPMTNSVTCAEELLELAEAKKKTLMVDHTFLYTGAVRKIKSMVMSGDIGRIQYFDSVRINLGLFQHDSNVVWDLAPHDVSIMNYLLDERPTGVVATGMCHTNNGIEDIAYLTLYFKSSVIAHFSVSWASPVKIRKILIGGNKKMVVYDDIEPTEKVRVYDSGYTVSSVEEQNRLKVDYRVGDVFLPKLDATEALRSLADDFVKSIMHGAHPVADARSGLDVVRVLEAAEQSIKSRGKEVAL
jgi:predicted dehydrogenase